MGGRRIPSGWWAAAFLWAGAVLVAAPFAVMIINAFKPGPEILHSPLSLPERWTVSGFVKVFQSGDLVTMFGNSLFISSSVAVLNVLFDSMVAYALAKLRFPGRKFLFGLVLGSMMIPSILLLIPTYSMMYEWGWVNTYRVMILPVSVSAYHIFLIRQYFLMIPDTYLEAARMDGAGEWRIFWKVMLPMSRPVLATVAILSFMGSWNDLFSALLYLRDESMFTLQLGLYSFKTRIPGQFLEQLWAATTLVTLPVVIVFMFLQKHFVEAFTGAGLK